MQHPAGQAEPYRPAPPFSSWLRAANGTVCPAASPGEAVVDPGPVRLTHLRVKQRVSGHQGALTSWAPGPG